MSAKVRQEPHRNACSDSCALAITSVLSSAVTAFSIAWWSRSASGVRTTRQNTGTLNAIATLILAHFAHLSTSACRVGSRGQKSSSPYAEARYRRIGPVSQSGGVRHPVSPGWCHLGSVCESHPCSARRTCAPHRGVENPAPAHPRTTSAPVHSMMFFGPRWSA